MQCPACKHELTEKVFNEINVDACENGCGGLWFDNFELKKFDEAHEEAGTDLLEVKIDPNVKVNHQARRSCPICPNVVMMRHFFSADRKVEVDECPQCAGIWLDAGELRDIRNLAGTEEERRGRALKFFDDTFSTKMKEMRQKSGQDAGRAKKVARLFRFLCPSNYLPGKQDGGAF